MIIFLYGPDSYRRRQKLNEIVSEYKEKHSSFSIDYFDLSAERKEDLQRLKDFVKTRSLFDDLRLGIIRGGSALEKKEQKEYLELLKENLKSKEPILAVEEDKKPVKEFKFLLEKPALCQEFENLSGEKLEDFLEKEAKKRNLTFDKKSQDLLIGAFNGDIWGLITELDKLSLLDEKEINQKILENHLDVFLPINIFSVINEMRNSKSAGSRLSLLEELLARSEDSAMIFNIVAVSAYADKKWKKDVADYDAAIKSGKLEYQEVLLDLILSK